MTAPNRACPDDGRCHHGCVRGCFRVAHAGPLSGVFPGDSWPAAVRAESGDYDTEGDRDGFEVAFDRQLEETSETMPAPPAVPVGDGDGLRDRIAALLSEMPTEFISPDEFGGFDVDYRQAADIALSVVSPLLAERDAEIRCLRSELSVERERSARFNALAGRRGGRLGRVAGERNLLLWLHAEARWQRDQAVQSSKTQAMVEHGRRVTAEQYDDLTRKFDASRAQALGQYHQLADLVDVHNPDRYLTSWDALIERVAELITGGTTAAEQRDEARRALESAQAEPPPALCAFTWEGIAWSGGPAPLYRCSLPVHPPGSWHRAEDGSQCSEDVPVVSSEEG